MSAPTLEQSRRWRAENPEMVKKYARGFRDARQSALDTYKLERGCADCGYNEYPEALDFDHVTGEKRNHVSLLLRHRLEDLIAEIEKCEVVCANCHRVRTATRRRNTA